jgi:leucine dehydrogenase
MTALGVYIAIQTCCERVFGNPSLEGRTVSILGLGHVGERVARHCARAGAKLIVADVNQDRRVAAERLGARWMTPERALEAKADVLSPCALGGVLNDDTVPKLHCRIVAGAANNQLATDEIADLLVRRDVLWAPDFVANAGGLINIAEEFAGYDPAAARRRVQGIGDTLREIFDKTESIGTTPLIAALELARQRLLPD